MKLVIPLLFSTILSYGQTSVLGKWKTVDESGEEKSIIEIFERNDKVYGKIVRIFTQEDPDPICDQCPSDDPRFGKKIIGMEIIKDMVKDGEEYTQGTILDPQDGKIYRCRIWTEGADLKVRGYWGPFYRTQTWKKVD
ncbi:MAG TPA: DUF2147 domain-containing protein [Chryseolinea sp.]|jgi:uncharacterized protein (DUF2147 family)|nr:DUF2147 domain-containing protein [Chryseolinea sp.]